MKKLPAFHYHPGGKDFANPTFKLMNKNEIPIGTIFQTQCKDCGRWGFLSSQWDNETKKCRLIGQGHTHASRIFNGMPVYGVLLLRAGHRYVFNSTHSYVKVLYGDGDELIEGKSLYDGYAVVPIFKDDYQLVSGVNRNGEQRQLQSYAIAIAKLYDGVTASEFNRRLVNHFHRLIVGSVAPTTFVPRIGLGGKL